MEKVIDIADRIPTLRERRRKRSNLKFLILIIVFLLTLFLLLYFQSPYSEIDKITIVGADIIPAENYLEKSELVLGESMWGFSKKDIEKKLKELKVVKEVKVKRQLLTTVVISIEEYKKVAYITDNDLFYPILENGHVLKNNSSTETIDAPVFVGFDDEKIRNRLLKELSKLDSSTLTLISEIHSNVKDPYGITLFMNDGYEVRAEIPSLAKKLKFYPSIVAQIEQIGDSEKGIIDIEVGTYYTSFSDEYGNNKVKINTEEEKKGEEKSE